MGTAGITVITASENKPTNTSHSRYSGEHVVFSSYDTDRFIEELCKLGRRIGRKAVLVTYDDRVIFNVSKNRKRLKEHYMFLLPDHEQVSKLFDKNQFYELAEQLELPVPQTIRVSSEKDLLQHIEALRKPYLIKPSCRHHWFHEAFEETVGRYQKAFICSTPEELKELYSKIIRINPNVVVQEYIAGEDNCMYDVNIYADRNSKVKGYVIAQKLRVYPPVAGWGSHVKTIHNDEIYNSCLEIINKLRLKGLINIQFKRDSRTGEYRLIEIHTRTSIFDFLGARAGQNIPGLYYSSLTGKKEVASQDYRDGVRYINVDRDFKLLIRHGKSYNVPIGTWARSYLKTSVFDGLMLRDFYACLRRFI